MFTELLNFTVVFFLFPLLLNVCGDSQSERIYVYVLSKVSIFTHHIFLGQLIVFSKKGFSSRKKSVQMLSVSHRIDKQK